ncbi:transketolase family protein [Spirochaeta africana]|uniref:Transketolase, alpha subunit n=1 Tax=Spirochaeta africana (strain ATCC 700263 / DSM 8902 / Z-7692) TaxID=889378 RepID=H9UFE3_SPIAZ|nr:transketolase C-terminal domain-containing protein [Spirochaeta africana]AFG36236.1 transketolase, alpha subunit [Spirochaeta africana DSM 8902]
MKYKITRAQAAEGVEMRAVYGECLLEMAAKDERIVVLDADLMRANGTVVFREAYPERTFDVGVAEANMVGISAGLSAAGLIPFPASFTCFAARRTFDQFFISANYAQLNVKLTGTDPGVAAAFNGGTHMSFEDIGLMRTIPGLLICEPSDPVSLARLLPQIAARYGSSYLRLHRKPIVPIYDEDEQFELGKGKLVCEGSDLTIVAAGAIMVAEAIEAAEVLDSRGISAAVIDMHTIKPIDAELLLQQARKTGAVLTAENHQIMGGLGSAVAEVLVEGYPVPMQRIGIQDEFGEVGTQGYLQKRFGLTADRVAAAAEQLVARK